MDKRIRGKTLDINKLSEKIRNSPPKDVELYVDSIDELFCQKDFSRANCFMLNEKISEYLMKEAEEIAINHSICIKLHIKYGKFEDGKTAEKLIHEYYKRNTEKLLKVRKKKSKQWRLRLFLGILFLAVCHGISLIFSIVGGENSFSNLMQDSFEIMGWVAIWEPALYFLYTKREETYELSDSLQLENSWVEYDIK